MWEIKLSHFSDKKLKKRLSSKNLLARSLVFLRVSTARLQKFPSSHLHQMINAAIDMNRVITAQL